MSSSNSPAQSAASQRLSRWVWPIGLCIIAALGLVLFYLLLQATDRWEQYASQLPLLLGLNLTLGIVLVTVISSLLWRLSVRWRQGKFGSRLLLKLSLIFALVGVGPGVLIYVVSYQFVSRSIQAWFDVKVEGALDAGLSLARVTFDSLARDLGAQTQAAAQQLGTLTDTQALLELERIRNQIGAQDAALWTLSGRPLGRADQEQSEIIIARPSPVVLRQVFNLGLWTNVEGLEENSSGATITAMALVPSTQLNLISEPHILQIRLRPSPTLLNHAILVQQANREYRERALNRGALRQMYIGTLTLSLFLSVFFAIVLAVLLGNQLAHPLLVLLAGVRAVANGDLSPKPVLRGQNEIATLTRSFAQMTRQLAADREAVEHSIEQANLARSNLQTILDNLTAGVIVLDHHGRVISINPGATRILRVPLAAYPGKTLSAISGLEGFGTRVIEKFQALVIDYQATGLDHWQHAFDLQPHHAYERQPNQDARQEQTLTLLTRGALLPNQAWLLVFDDMSEIVSAQRTQARGEVALRLAHEIKNPLTPIQLSAERLMQKLSPKLEPAEQQFLTKSVRTIIDQVSAMERLVNEFRDYARLPQAELTPLDLNALLRELHQLYISDNQIAPVRLQIDESAPYIMGDQQLLRQVVHNLLQNALDACEAQVHPEITMITQYTPATECVHFIVRDTGTGFSPDVLRQAFQPYVTSKPRGTGLGLAMVKKIADEHRAKIELKNNVSEGQIKGAEVWLSFSIMASSKVGVT